MKIIHHATYKVVVLFDSLNSGDPDVDRCVELKLGGLLFESPILELDFLKKYRTMVEQTADLPQ